MDPHGTAFHVAKARQHRSTKSCIGCAFQERRFARPQQHIIAGRFRAAKWISHTVTASICLCACRTRHRATLDSNQRAGGSMHESVEEGGCPRPVIRSAGRRLDFAKYKQPPPAPCPSSFPPHPSICPLPSRPSSPQLDLVASDCSAHDRVRLANSPHPSFTRYRVSPSSISFCDQPCRRRLLRPSRATLLCLCAA